MWGLSTIACELVISHKLHYTLRMILDLYILYKEGVSKTHQAGLDHRKVKPKIVCAYQNVLNPEHCNVNFYLKYLSVPAEGLVTND